MASPRVSRRVPFLSQPAAGDEVDTELLAELPDLLDHIPEVEPQAPPPFPYSDGAAIAQPTDTRELLQTLQAETQAVLAAQFERVQHELDARNGDRDARLLEAQAMIEELRDENARLLRQLDLYERAFSTLKELTRDVDEQNQG